MACNTAGEENYLCGYFENGARPKSREQWECQKPATHVEISWRGILYSCEDHRAPGPDNVVPIEEYHAHCAAELLGAGSVVEERRDERWSPPWERPDR